MRICLVTPELPPYRYGGIGSYVLALATEYADLGHEVAVIGPDIHDSKEQAHGWGISRSIPVDSKWATLLSKATSPTTPMPGLWRLRSMATASMGRATALAVGRCLNSLDGKYNIVELPNWPGLGAYLRRGSACIVARLSSPSTLCVTSSSDYFTMLERRTCERADSVIANSFAIRETCSHLYGDFIEDAAIIPHGIQNVTRYGLKPRQDGVDLLVVGRAEDRKGTDYLLRVAHKVISQRPSARFIFIGADIDSYVRSSRELHELWQFMKSMHPEQLLVLGKVDDQEKLKWYERAHLTLVPSRYESFGLVAVESLRAGTPVLAASAGGLREVLEGCKGSQLLAVENVDEWVSAITKAVDSGSDALLSQRKSSLEAFESRFTSARMAKSSLLHYEEVLRRVGRGGIR